MNKTAWTVIGVIEVILFAAMAIWCFVSGGCTTQLETTAGGTCYMKCFWCFKAVTVICVIGILTALSTLTCKTTEGRRSSAGISALTSGLGMLTTSSFVIGICSNPDMHCHTTQLVFMILAIVAIVIAIVQFAKCDPKAAEKPKMQL